MKLIRVIATALMVALTFPAALAAQGQALQSRTAETKDRLSPEAMERLVARPMALLRTDGLASAQKAFAELVAEAVTKHGQASVKEADLLTSFGVALYMEGMDRNDATLERASLAYLEKATAAYRSAFGPRHPEVAVGLNSYADVALGLRDLTLQPAAESALEEALSIRTEKLGPDNEETRTAANRLTELRDPQSAAMDDAISSAVETLAAAANQGSGEIVSDYTDHGIWKPITYYNPLIDEFIADIKDLKPDEGVPREAVAAKYRLSLDALNEAVALLRDMDKNAYNDRHKAALRSRA